MNPYEVGKPESLTTTQSDEEPDVEQSYESHLLRTFLMSAARITVYGILGLLLFVAMLYWLQ
jgi:hypothetical protein